MTFKAILCVVMIALPWATHAQTGCEEMSELERSSSSNDCMSLLQLSLNVIEGQSSIGHASRIGAMFMETSESVLGVGQKITHSHKVVKGSEDCPWMKTIVCAVGSVLLLGFLVLVFWCLSRSEGIPDKQISLIDNGRVIAMIFIVFGHWGLITHTPEMLDVLHDHAHNLVGMPMFTLISGIVSQGRPSPRRFRMVLVHIVLPALLYNVFLSPLASAAPFWFAQLREEHVLPPWQKEGVVPWWQAKVINGGISNFLLQLAGWRCCAFAAAELSAKIGAPLWLLLLSFTLPTMMFGAAFNDFWLSMFPVTDGFTGFVGMLPLFVVGLVTPFRQLLQCVSPSWPLRMLGTFVLMVWCFLPDHIYSFIMVLPFRGPWHGEIWISHGCTSADMNGRTLVWIWSLFGNLVKAVLLLLVLICIYPREEHWFTHVGRQTIYIYLLHFPAVKVLGGFGSLLQLHLSLPWLVTYLVSWGLVLALSVVLTSGPVRWMAGPLVQPDWLGNVLLGQTEDVTSEVSKDTIGRV